jgi:uncharacterized protein YecE (DUF72 family)
MYEYTATHFHDMEEAAAHYVSVSRSLLRDLQLVYEKSDKILFQFPQTLKCI